MKINQKHNSVVGDGFKKGLAVSTHLGQHKSMQYIKFVFLHVININLGKVPEKTISPSL